MKIKYFDITNRGITVKCKLYRTDAHTFSNVVISCHGFGGDKDNLATQKLAETLLPVHPDTAVLAFDWPGHGNDTRQKPDLEDCNQYLDEILLYARNTLGAKAFFNFSTSFGGYVTLRYIYQKGNPFEKVLLRCPAVMMYQVLTESIMEQGQLEQLRKKDILVGFERKVRVSGKFLEQLRQNDITVWDYSRLTENLLILHGTKDELVSCSQVQEFAEKNGIDFLSIQDADHRFREPAKIREVIDYTIEHYFG